jgi:asparagine synthase (glutamine-hydrolysing)
MCGIAGIVSLANGAGPPPLDQLGAMVSAIRHRGPDEFGLYRDERAGLVHARLSIIDVATGQQPLANEDGTLWAAFNGEIFNYLELRDELRGLGHRFRTSSDTEVIVHAFESWGSGAFDRFNGQWAVALWDSRRRALTLARDPLGVRPLYHCEHQGRLYFASEVKAIFAADRGIARAFDPVGLAEVFTFWTVVPPQTVFRGVAEIEPGCARQFRDGAATDVRTWSAPFPQGDEALFNGSVADAADATRSALEEATRLRMLRADVPVGSYLSGGLDSSLTAALGLRAKGTRFHTFSLRFEDAEYDETRFQRLMAERLGSEHHEILVSRADISRAFPEVCFHAERPVLRTAPAPLFLLSRLVRETGIKAVLTGEGADEVFAGYDVFREGKVRRFWARAPGSSRRPQLLARLYPYLARSPVAQSALARQFFGRDLAGWRRPGFAHEPRWHSAASLQRLFSPDQQRAAAAVDVVARLLDRLPPEFGNWSFLAQDQYLEVRTLLSGYLLSAQGDRMLMGHSVEGRFPFLDRHVVALANSFPAGYKLRVLDEKHVLKRASEGLVPREIIARTKQPYRAPDALAFVGSSTPDWLDVISERALADAGVFDPGAARKVYEKCRARSDEAQFSNADNMALVGILSTQLVHDSLIRRLGPSEPPASYRTYVDHLGGPRG